ncbi:hypothetical protein CRE_31626 [Caenorhabditis remanei]|uniref:DNA helicase Pif1-like 2B domain-containing protein n=1 Tax=Caenorhabditis remanei TaxID=31234 RepID=E3NTD1_CAERE|nr:hypothetical protein CRE_31626 [Caenorhabditis remanei]
MKVVPTEFLNSINTSSLPPHGLKLKVGSIRFLRNLDVASGLCHGTRLMVLELVRKMLEVLSGEQFKLLELTVTTTTTWHPISDVPSCQSVWNLLSPSTSHRDNPTLALVFGFIEQALRLHDRLTESGFFEVYAEFSDYQRLKHSRVAAWTDGNVELIRSATEKFFRKFYDLRRGEQDSEFICIFETRDADLGGRPLVKIHGKADALKYNVKCHHHGPKGSSSGQVPDVTEFYIYKLLYLIGVGPRTHIVPPETTTGSKTSTYIATQWDDRFELLKDVIGKNKLCEDVAVQLVMLRVLLFIADLHQENCGRWRGTTNAAIVDFAPTSDFEVYEDIRFALRTRFPHRSWKNEYTAVRNKFDEKSWLKIGKVHFDRWDLVNKIELAREEFDPTKGILKELEIGFKKRRSRESPTDQLNEYIDTLRKNLMLLQSLLNSLD